MQRDTKPLGPQLLPQLLLDSFQNEAWLVLPSEAFRSKGRWSFLSPLGWAFRQGGLVGERCFGFHGEILWVIFVGGCDLALLLKWFVWMVFHGIVASFVCSLGCLGSFAGLGLRLGVGMEGLDYLDGLVWLIQCWGSRVVLESQKVQTIHLASGPIAIIIAII